MIPRQIVTAAMRLREVYRVQPVLRPALAIARRRKQPIHQMLVCLRITVPFKRFDFGQRRWQAMQIIEHTTNERAPVRLRRRCQLPLREPRPDESIHGLLDHPAPGDWKCRFHQRLQ